MGFTNPYPASRLTVDSTNSLASGLVGFWPLTDGTGGTAKDITTNANDGTISGTVLWESGLLGQNLQFNGTSNFIDTGTTPAATSLPLTVSAWIKPSATTNRCMIASSWLSSGTNRAFLCELTASNALTCYITSDGTFSTNSSMTTTGTLTDGVWYHVVFVIQSGGAIYVDGVSQALSGSLGSSMMTPNQKLLIGAAEPGAENFFWTGDLQNIRMYDRALSATEVATLYHRPWEGTNYGDLWPYSPPTPSNATLSTDTAATSLMSGCVGWWPLTDGSGTTATDLVGSSNGAESGGVSWASSEIGTVASFDGVDDYFELGTASTLFAGPTITATLTCWVKPSTTSQIPIGNQYTSGERLYITTENSIWNIGFGSYGWGTGTGTGYSVATDEWTFLAIVINSGSPTLYVNAQQSITNPTDTSVSLGGPFTIGAFLNAGSIFSGVTDPSETQNVRIWDRVLTDDEISLLYERPWEGIEYGDAFHYDPPTPANLTPLTSDSINTDQEFWLPLTETDDYASGAADISGNSNNGTQSGGVLSEASPLGGVASFDGVNDYITASTPTISQPASLSLWFKTTDARGQIIDGDDATDRLAVYLVSNQLYFYSGGADKLIGSAGDYNDGVWHHIVVNFDTTTDVYIDGVLVTSQSAGSNQLSGITIGARYNFTENLVGLISNVRLWSRVLTADEVWGIYENPWLGSAYQATSAEVLYNYIFRSQRFRRLA